MCSSSWEEHAAVWRNRSATAAAGKHNRNDIGAAVAADGADDADDAAVDVGGSDGAGGAGGAGGAVWNSCEPHPRHRFSNW